MSYRDAPTVAPLLVVATTITALDRTTGEVRWTYPLGGPARKFVIEQERVVVLDAEGTVHCLDLASGTLVGRVVLGLGQANAMLSDGDRIYVSSDCVVVALDRNGRELWRRDVANNGAWGLGGLGIPGVILQPDFSRS